MKDRVVSKVCGIRGKGRRKERMEERERERGVLFNVKTKERRPQLFL